MAKQTQLIIRCLSAERRVIRQLEDEQKETLLTPIITIINTSDTLDGSAAGRCTRLAYQAILVPVSTSAGDVQNF